MEKKATVVKSPLAGVELNTEDLHLQQQTRILSRKVNGISL